MSACERYAYVANVYDKRLVGALAQLRRHLLSCPMASDDHSGMVWNRVLTLAGNIDGKAGVELRSELAWMLENMQGEVFWEWALKLTKDHHFSNWLSVRAWLRLRNLLAARSIRMSTSPFAVMRSY